MSLSAAQSRREDSAPDPEAVCDRFLPLQLAQTAQAAGRLVFDGLAVRGLADDAVSSGLIGPDGALHPKVEPLARAYEAALLSTFTPSEVATLRRLLTRVETAALRLTSA